MNKSALLNALTLLAQAYAFAKDGNEKMAGKLFVQAAADDNLDDVMDGMAQGAAEVDDDDQYEDVPDDTGEEDSTEIEAHVELPESVARLAARTLV